MGRFSAGESSSGVQALLWVLGVVEKVRGPLVVSLWLTGKGKVGA